MYTGTLARVAGTVLLYASLAGVASATTIALPSCTISVPPGTHYIGQSVRLLWVSQYASSASITTLGTLPQSQVAQGYRDIYPSGNTLITMSVSNTAGTRTCSAQIMMTKVPVQTQTVYQQVPYNQIRYVPTTSNNNWWQPTNQSVWVPFWSTQPTYEYAYDDYYGSSPYYTDNYFDRYESFYDVAIDDYYGVDSSPYSVTDPWENAATGEALYTYQNCSGSWCDAEPSAWIYSSPADSWGGQETRIGYFDETGNNVQYTYNENGDLVGAGRSIPVMSDEEWDNMGDEWYDAN